MICPSCGGDYADWAIKCPYCGSTNDSADEQAYLKHLEEVRNRLDVVDEEAETVYRKGVAGTLKKGVILVAVLALGVVVLILGFRFLTGRKAAIAEKRALAQLEWSKEEYPKLDEMYEKGDFDGIVEEYRRVSSDKKTSEFGLYSWAHYPFCIDYYRSYRDMKYLEQMIQNGEQLDSYHLGVGIYGGILFTREATESRLDQLMESYQYNGGYGITEEEAELIRGYSVEAETFMHETMNWSDEEIDELFEKCDRGGFVAMSPCFDLADEMLADNKKE